MSSVVPSSVKVGITKVSVGWDNDVSELGVDGEIVAGGFPRLAVVNCTDTVIAASVYNAPGFPSGRGSSWARLQAPSIRQKIKLNRRTLFFIIMSPEINTYILIVPNPWLNSPPKIIRFVKGQPVFGKYPGNIASRNQSDRNKLL